LLHQLDAHDEVFVEEAPGVLAISADPADHGRKMDNHLWPHLAHQLRDRLRLAQIVLAGTRSGDVVKSGARQFFDHKTPEKPRTAGDQEPHVRGRFSLPICHFLPTLQLSRSPSGIEPC
jgi:hypothetical protein